MQRHRVVFAVTSLRGGGAEAVGVAWANGLAAAGWRVRVVALSDTEGAERLDPAVELVDASAHPHGGRARRVAREADDLGAAAVVALQTYPDLVALAARLGRRRTPWAVVVTEHNLISLGLAGSSLPHRVKIRLAKLSYRFADHVVACSHPVAAELVAAFGARAGRCSVVLNPALAEPAGARVARQPGGDRIDVVLAGRLVAQKRPLVAVDVVAALREEGRDARLVLIGAGPLGADVRAAARAAGIPVVDHGWLADWPAALTPHSVLLLASAREGLGNVLVEAAARGVPSVAPSTALGVADAVVPGVTGVLAAAGDARSLADAVAEAATLPMTEVPRWLERFTAEASSRALGEVVEAAAQRRGAR
ncbi:glycosyltransferase [Microbacterium sp. No. 7]|uniref:glycosyltransferase n=1 Tax=Microbacterium sp. No. 7 TaxID=1714373 RepID=UPI0006ED1E14|nr:glycosyltransferase [Microbacterium sp. No. 7]ALJ19082.1 hypothetical protein AOA12_03850 [Microbacterium sp. No. 7]